MNRRGALAFIAAPAIVCITQANAQAAGWSAPMSAPSSKLRGAWARYAKAFLTKDGRVIDTGNKNITHTEGLGVSMLVAQACDDKASFARMWEFTRTLQRPDGLFSWKWVPGSGVVDPNNATDGDLYIAWALLRAGQRWADRELLRAAAQIARACRLHLFANTYRGTLLLPGKDGFIQTKNGSEIAIINPSYWVLPALHDIGAADVPSAWSKVYEDGLRLLATSRFGARALPSDWVEVTDPLQPWSERPARFGYEAIRTPLFLAWDRKWGHPALKAVAQFMEQPGFPAWVSLKDATKAEYAAPAGFESIAQLARKAVYGKPLGEMRVDNDYYSSSLSLMALMAAQDCGWLAAE